MSDSRAYQHIWPLWGGLLVGILVILWWQFPLVWRFSVKTIEDGVTQESVQLRFSRPVRQQTVESRWKVSPQISGTFQWKNQTLTFSPAEPLPRGEVITFTLESGVEDFSGKKITHPLIFHTSLPASQLLFLQSDGQLARATIAGESEALTDGKGIVKYHVARNRSRVAYLHQPSPQSPTELWSIHPQTKKNTQVRHALPLRLTELQLSADGNFAYVLGRPLSEAQSGTVLYRINLQDGVSELLSFGTVDGMIHQFQITHDGASLVLSDVAGEKYLWHIQTGKLASLGKLSTYRGSSFWGSTLVFENYLPEEASLSEIVLSESEGQRILPTPDGNASQPVISPGGTHVFYSFQSFSLTSFLQAQQGKYVLDYPLASLRKQGVHESTAQWEVSSPHLSFELSAPSPDARFVAVEVFTREQLSDLQHLRTTGEPNKPEIAAIQVLDAQTGQFLPVHFTGREIQWF